MPAAGEPAAWAARTTPLDTIAAAGLTAA